MDALYRGKLGEWACFSLGSNLGKRMEMLERAMDGLEEALGNPGRRSPIYESAPLGFESEHAFLNCCMAIPTLLDPVQIFRQTRELEDALGRKRSGKGYGDRSIDIDFLLFGEHLVESPELQLPHPRMHLRRFVLQPLADIDPALRHPRLGSRVGDLLERCPDRSGLKVL